MKKNLAEINPEIVSHGLKLLDNWHKEILEKFPNNEDPMKIVLREGGPFHSRDLLGFYVKRLKESGREDMVKKILSRKESYSLNNQ